MQHRDARHQHNKNKFPNDWYQSYCKTSKLLHLFRYHTHSSLTPSNTTSIRHTKMSSRTARANQSTLTQGSHLFFAGPVPTSSWVLVCSHFLLLLLLGSTTVDATSIACLDNADCETALMPGSVCQEESKTCSNPFHQHGCLASLMDEPRRSTLPKRVCTTADPPQAAAMGYCRPLDLVLQYAELRIYTQNWESVFFEAWILQILLTEYLGVAVTLESGVAGVTLDFHDQNLAFGYGSGNDYSLLETALELGGDCTTANQQKVASNNNEIENDGAEEDEAPAYRPCAHFVPEIWTTQKNRLEALKDDGVIEQHEGLGVVGQMNWWIPKYTALRDPTLLTYFGLAGEERRRKLADIFQRPTKWGDYCSQVSVTRCMEPDGVAKRAPANEAEAGLYFDAQDYTGHFRKTEESDCDAHPDTCTGHIADFPCGWSSFVQQQTYHLGIPLTSSGNEPGCRGYNYGEFLGIIDAANATKSNLIFQWWQPDVLHNKFQGTDAEFQAVGMPLPTLDCIEHTVSSVDRCDPDPVVRRGSAEGACGEVSTFSKME